MMRGITWASIIAALIVPVRTARAQRYDSLSVAVKRFVRVGTPRVILTHITVIDGTGAPAMRDRNVIIENGRIAAIRDGADETASAGTTVLDLRGSTVMPGIVGMHEHLFYLVFPGIQAGGSFDPPSMFQEMAFSAPRLYLAAGVTTARTAGSVEPYTDLRLRQTIESGATPGPHLFVTGPYLEGASDTPWPSAWQLTGPDDARQLVAYWADHGVTSFKAYQHITRAELAAAIAEAHTRGLKVTGHLCSVTYAEAVAAGIDNLEHGFFVNTALDPGKEPDTCSAARGDSTLMRLAPGSAEANQLIALLVEHHVAITSTLPSTAASLPRSDPFVSQPAARTEVWEAMSPSAREAYVFRSTRAGATSAGAALLLRRDMELERAFVAAGGLLISGADPVGVNALIPGFADQRQIELLVDAGFTPVEAIRIATLNGAIFLGRDATIGSIAIGKNADLVIVKGDPSVRIGDIENVTIVFKDGVGYDSAKLLEAVRGHYGDY